jgi:hypothetical protein
MRLWEGLVDRIVSELCNRQGAVCTWGFRFGLSSEQPRVHARPARAGKVTAFLFEVP